MISCSHNVCVCQNWNIKLKWLTAGFRCRDAQFLHYVLPRWKREHLGRPAGSLRPSSVLTRVIEVDSEAAGVRVLLGVRSGGRVDVRERVAVARWGAGGRCVHVGQQDTGHVLLGAINHLMGVRQRDTSQNWRLKFWTKGLIFKWARVLEICGQLSKTFIQSFKLQSALVLG